MIDVILSQLFDKVFSLIKAGFKRATKKTILENQNETSIDRLKVPLLISKSKNSTIRPR